MATAGLVFATAYSLRIMQKIFLGNEVQGQIPDLSFREKLIMVPAVVLIIWLGIFPMKTLEVSKVSVKYLLGAMAPSNSNEMSGGGHE